MMNKRYLEFPQLRPYHDMLDFLTQAQIEKVIVLISRCSN